MSTTTAQTEREAPPAEADLKQRMAAYWSWRSDGFERAQGVRNAAQKRAWLDFLRDAAGAAPQAALDVGTGTGFLALLLAELGHDCKAIDLAPGMVEQARELARQRGLAVRFEVGDAESLAEAEGSYDLVISRNVLWTLPDPQRALRDWRRVLKPGGKLLLVDGDWFDDRPSYRLQKFLSKLWIALTRLRNPWADERRLRREYNSGFDHHLPMMRPGNRDNMPKVVAASGFEGVRMLEMREVDAAERIGKTLSQRLANPSRFFAIVATRP
jgi:ubiquinone/menaquinone biosynthesis C-methylase UbiE